MGEDENDADGGQKCLPELVFNLALVFSRGKSLLDHPILLEAVQSRQSLHHEENKEHPVHVLLLVGLVDALAELREVDNRSILLEIMRIITSLRQFVFALVL